MLKMITSEQIADITNRIVANVKPEKIVLFGSYARGNPTEESDLDLFVIKESTLPRYKRGQEIRKHLRRLKVPIDLVVYTKDEIARWREVRTAFITTVVETGIVLYEQRDVLLQKQFVMPASYCHPVRTIPRARQSSRCEGRFFQRMTTRGALQDNPRGYSKLRAHTTDNHETVSRNNTVTSHGQ